MSENFDRQWNEVYSLFPEIALAPFSEREKWKEFAKRIADLHSHHVEHEREKSYDEGSDDGYKAGQLNMKEEILDFITDNMEEDEMGESKKNHILYELYEAIQKEDF